MNINLRQNSEWNLKRLAAQRQLYSQAKKVMIIQFVLSGIFTVSLAISGSLIDEKYLVYTVLVAVIIVFLDELLLSKKIDRIKEEAAKIQEEFDCDVLQLQHNDIKFINTSMLEIIQEKSKMYISKHNNYDALLNWYPGIDEAENRYYSLICQATNCWWNQTLRKKYSEFLIFILTAVFLVLLFIAIIKGITVAAFIMSVFSPILPACVLIYKITRDNCKAIRNLNHMKVKLDEIIIRIKSGNSYSDGQLTNDLRCLQDMIFDNRSSSPLIPDKLYFRHRNRYEEIALETNKDLVTSIQNVC